MTCKIRKENLEKNANSSRNRTKSDETPFVRIMNVFFSHFGFAIAQHPYIFLGISVLLTLATSAVIPFTELTNNVADFTPLEARARMELETYKNFFANKGEPIAIYVLVTAKNPTRNMLGIRQLNETVRLLNTISERFKIYNPEKDKSESFTEFCDNFCTINEPVRHFFNGLTINNNFGVEGNVSEHIDLGYPITTVLGRQLHMDPNFFGVKVAIEGENNQSIVVNQLRSSKGESFFDLNKNQLKNNIREIKLIGLQFRAEKPPAVSAEAVKKWETDILNYLQREFQSDYVNAYILSESFLTTEVVRAGLSLLPFLLIGFFIMIIFSVITMNLAALYMDQFALHKSLLAVVACVCPFMACGTALGLMFIVGFRFGSILCVTPFLVLALGVDDAYLMLNSWQRLRKIRENEIKFQKTSPCNSIKTNSSFCSTNCSSDSASTSSSSSSSSDPDEAKFKVRELMIEVLMDTGPSITITMLTNVLAFVIGAMTPTPEIQLFSIGNAVAIFIDYIYEWTIFGSFMAIVGQWEFVEQCVLDNRNAKEKEQKIKTDSTTFLNLKNLRKQMTSICSKFIDYYCAFLTNIFTASLVLLLLVCYMYISIYGVLNIRAELRPEQLFLQSSDVIKIMDLRNEYIIPFYSVCIIFVNKPGNISNPVRLAKLNSLVSNFESLPSSVGKYSTKYWLRDYEHFIQENEEDPTRAAIDELATFEGLTANEKNKNEIRQFLNWPEFEFWKGFLQIEENSADDKKDFMINKFFFTTAFFGAELKEWSKREQLLNQWRHLADSYPELEVSVYEDDAKFLDLIPTLISQTAQSSLWTLLCMFLVCLLFMTHPTTLLVSNFAIFSTCVGVFGILSLTGTDLDPIVMSAAIMSIGFAVDIPAHISYHFYKSGLESEHELTIKQRLRHCIAAIGFPILEAGISTIICVSSLMFVTLHMAQVFARTMILVVAIGLVHGLLIIPVMFFIISLLPMPKHLPPPSPIDKKSKIVVVVLSPEENPPETVPVSNSSETQKSASADLMNSENGILRINLSTKNIPEALQN